MSVRIVLQYSWTNDRLWRKNRRQQLLCPGVDLNRNFNDHWGGVSDQMMKTNIHSYMYHPFYLGWYLWFSMQ